MIVAIKQFSREINQPWYVIVNDKGKIGARKFATREEADACALRLRNNLHTRAYPKTPIIGLFSAINGVF